MIQINKIFFIVMVIISFNSMMTMEKKTGPYCTGPYCKHIDLPTISNKEESENYYAGEESLEIGKRSSLEKSKNSSANKGNFIINNKITFSSLGGFCTGVIFYRLFSMIPEDTEVEIFKLISDLDSSNLKIFTGFAGVLSAFAIYKYINTKNVGKSY